MASVMVVKCGNVGKLAVYNGDGWEINVRILDVKFAYGNYSYQIKPVEGSGSKWVSEYSVEVAP